MKVNEHLSILFLLVMKKSDKQNRAPIWARITIDGLRSEISLAPNYQTGTCTECLPVRLLHRLFFQRIIEVKAGNDICRERWQTLGENSTSEKRVIRNACRFCPPLVAGIVYYYAEDPYYLVNDVLLPVKSYPNYNGYLKEVQDCAVFSPSSLRTWPGTEFNHKKTCSVAGL
ncbi:hypothetical protein [Chitinophaga sp.]|uniref:hypothetical protein n=1 Tax=Chitinophaga sp. TaxID=1869181 RepID=UPI002604D7AB|nr:hypothetical protein [uncultured Chitinophaga sp.]